MINEVWRFAWFAKASWYFLACDKGTDRHKHRVEYFKGFPKAFWTFRKECIKDGV